MSEHPDTRIERLAARQHGVFTRAQARDGGLSRAAIVHRLDKRRWIAVTRRVYRIAGAPATPRAELIATVLSAGRDGVATGSSALALHGIRGFDLLPPRVVIGRRPHALALSGVVETFRLRESHCTLVDGIPTATVARALFDLAGPASKRRLARAVDAALAARKVTVPQLLEVIDDLAERGRAGSRNLRAVIAEREVGYRAPATDLESLLLELVVAAGLPEPERQVSLTGHPGWIGVVDFAWRVQRVIVETDGAAFHDSMTDRENDERRDRALEATGWTVLRFNWNDLTKRPTSVIATIRRALAVAV
jgi:very-short-patch-repair endonuclease